MMQVGYQGVLEILPDGTIRIVPSTQVSPGTVEDIADEPDTPLDRWRRKRDARTKLEQDALALRTDEAVTDHAVIRGRLDALRKGLPPGAGHGRRYQRGQQDWR